MTNEADPLAVALRRLVQPYSLPTLQTDEHGGSYVTVVEHTPLLSQLRGAIAGGTGPHSGDGASDPSRRIPFDPGAQAVYANIERIARGWYEARGLRPVGMTLEGLLVEWFRAYASGLDEGKVDRAQYERRAARVQGWCDQIEALFDPPTLVPLSDPCPVCGRARIVNGEGEHVLALVVEYWKQADRVTRTNARCRGGDCKAEWVGWTGVEALMSTLDERAAAHIAGEHEHAHALAVTIATGTIDLLAVEAALTGAIPTVTGEVAL